jgi:hypothetical protein
MRSEKPSAVTWRVGKQKSFWKSASGAKNWMMSKLYGARRLSCNAAATVKQ